MVFLVLCLAVVGDIGYFFNSMWTGNELVSHNAGLLIPGANAFLIRSVSQRSINKWVQRVHLTNQNWNWNWNWNHG